MIFVRMKFPGKIGQFFQKAPEKRELYLSLLLDNDHVAGAAWFVNAKGRPELTHAVARRTDADSWEERIVSADEVITALVERTGTEDIHKVIFGLPYEYLTEEGDIRPEIRSQLKQFSAKLSLKPIGFVPVHHAVAHRLKQDEGIPPSVILISYTRKNVSVSVYKVGNLVGRKVIPSDTLLLSSIERMLSETSGGEVLPSRMLLFGMDMKHLEALKSEMTRYPWPSKVNFLHFPKIDIVPPDTAVSSVSLAGASELSKVMTDEEIPDEAGVAGAARTKEKEAGRVSEEDGKEPEPETGNGEEEEAKEPEETEDKEKEVAQESRKEPEYAVDEVANVRYVSPESVGFHSGKDILEKETPAARETPTNKAVHRREPVASRRPLPADEEEAVGPSASKTDFADTLRGVTGMAAGLFSGIGKIRFGHAGLFIGAGVAVIGIAAVLAFLAFVYPSASVEISLSKKEISDSSGLTIDPDATSVNQEKRIIPGRVEKLTVSGEKSVPATGKKKVGDPARGTVTIYNKSLSSRTFKKGSVLVGGGLEFTLDEEVKVASATESIGSITFGKGDAAITASAIGTQSNLPANTEFTFEDVPSSTAIARNNAALVGGTSRDVVVVSRTDQDNLVKAVSAELVEKAKAQLADKVSGSQKLIDGTIDTEVTEKVFSQEVDEESKNVSGTVKLTVTGTAYDENDAKQLVLAFIKAKVPQGYTLSEQSLMTSLTDLKVNKDGTITGKMDVTASAVPQFAAGDIAARIRGKSVADAEKEIRAMTGVADVRISVKNLLFGGKLPIRETRIAVSVQSK